MASKNSLLYYLRSRTTHLLISCVGGQKKEGRKTRTEPLAWMDKNRGARNYARGCFAVRQKMHSPRVLTLSIQIWSRSVSWVKRTNMQTDECTRQAQNAFFICMYAKTHKDHKFCSPFQSQSELTAPVPFDP